MTTEERPYTIAVPDEQLEFLQKKLELTRFPDELQDAGMEYGAPLEDIKRLVARWRDGYDWRKHETTLNAELPQFIRGIAVDGHGVLDIHYVHKKSEVDGAIPLLFVHGWPGNFTEVRKMLPLLVAASDDHPSFHVVALSLPGYGFSSGPTKKGFGLDQYAEVGNKLMLALGYDEYVTQGGDWGYHITRRIAVNYGGKHSKAWHTNFPRTLRDVAPPSFLEHPLIALSEWFFPLSDIEKAQVQRTKLFREKGRGYAIEQETQPQTLGYSLADSPVGILGWIYEKLVNWSDAYPWEDDEAGPAASVRIYTEHRRERDRKPSGWQGKPQIPMGFSYFPKEIWSVPKRWLWDRTLVFEGEHDSGGHFAAHEKPELLVEDIRRMFGEGGPAFGVVSGKTGYRA